MAGDTLKYSTQAKPAVHTQTWPNHAVSTEPTVDPKCAQSFAIGGIHANPLPVQCQHDFDDNYLGGGGVVDLRGVLWGTLEATLLQLSTLCSQLSPSQLFTSIANITMAQHTLPPLPYAYDVSADFPHL